jgi:very-short-patch-repair endonuclease
MDLGDIAVDDLVSAAQARELGMSYAALRRRVAAGDLHRVIHGWYAVRAPTNPADSHRLRAKAWVRHLRGAVVASHHSAVLLHGLPRISPDLRTVHVARAVDRQTRRGHGLAVHPAAGVATAIDREWGRSTTLAVPVALAVVQTGMVNGAVDSLVAGDAALRLGMTSMRDIDVAANLLRRQPGMAAVRAVLPQLDPRHESPGETRLAHVMRGLGFRFTPQVWVRGTQDWRVDFLLDDAPVVVEFDGAVKYGDGERGRQALLAEKRREDGLRAMGYEVVRVTWADLAHPQVVRAGIAAAVRRSRRLPTSA